MNIFLLLYCNMPFLLLENLINFFTAIVQIYSDSLNRFFSIFIDTFYITRYILLVFFVCILMILNQYPARLYGTRSI